jgi:hypothetical protein
MTNPYTAPSANADSFPSGSGTITEVMMEALRRTKGWVRLVGVMLFIGAVFCLIAALGMVAGSGMGAAAKGMPAGMLTGMAAMYVVIAFIYFFLGLYLVKYASAIGRLLSDGLAESMEEALQHQQKFWRLAGFLTLITVVLGVIGMVAAIAIPLMMRG